MPKTVSELEELKENHSAWKLLGSKEAPFIIYFLNKTFLTGNAREIGLGSLKRLLKLEIEKEFDIKDDDALEMLAKVYIQDWLSPEKGWLTRCPGSLPATRRMASSSEDEGEASSSSKAGATGRSKSSSASASKRSHSHHESNAAANQTSKTSLGAGGRANSGKDVDDAARERLRSEFSEAYDAGSDEFRCDLSASAERAINWALQEGGDRRSPIGAYLMVIETLLDQIHAECGDDPELIIERLEERKRDIDTEIARLRSHGLSKVHDALVKEKIQLMDELSHELLSMFRSVREHFDTLDSEFRAEVDEYRARLARLRDEKSRAMREIERKKARMISMREAEDASFDLPGPDFTGDPVEDAEFLALMEAGEASGANSGGMADAALGESRDSQGQGEPLGMAGTGVDWLKAGVFRSETPKELLLAHEGLVSRRELSTPDLVRKSPLGEFLLNYPLESSNSGRRLAAFRKYFVKPERRNAFSRKLLEVLSSGEFRNVVDFDEMHDIQEKWFDALQNVTEHVRALSDDFQYFIDDELWETNKLAIEKNARKSDEKENDAWKKMKRALPVSSKGMPAPEGEAAARNGHATSFKVLSTRRKAVEDAAPRNVKEGAISTRGLENAFLIDKKELKSNIWQALQTKERASLGEIVARHPLKQGLEELMTYFRIADDWEHGVDYEDENEIVGWTQEDGSAKEVELPKLVFKSRSGQRD